MVESMFSLIAKAQNHPAVTGTLGTLTSGTLAVAGEVVKPEHHSLQLWAWRMSIMVGFVTIVVLLPVGWKRWRNMFKGGG